MKTTRTTCRRFAKCPVCHQITPIHDLTLDHLALCNACQSPFAIITSPADQSACLAVPHPSHIRPPNPADQPNPAGASSANVHLAPRQRPAPPPGPPLEPILPDLIQTPENPLTPPPSPWWGSAAMLLPEDRYLVDFQPHSPAPQTPPTPSPPAESPTSLPAPHKPTPGPDHR